MHSLINAAFFIWVCVWGGDHDIFLSNSFARLGGKTLACLEFFNDRSVTIKCYVLNQELFGISKTYPPTYHYKWCKISSQLLFLGWEGRKKIVMRHIWSSDPQTNLRTKFLTPKESQDQTYDPPHTTIFTSDTHTPWLYVCPHGRDCLAIQKRYYVENASAYTEQFTP